MHSGKEMARKTVKTGFKGFTLSELLIALAILGVIATFTIPKVLQSQQDGKYKAMAKETIAAISEAYQVYTSKNSVSATFSVKDITPYLNYTKVDTTSTIDVHFGESPATHSCGDWGGKCLILHNGAALMWWDADVFGGTASSNGLPIQLDVDMKTSDNTTNGPGKSLLLLLYADGRVRTHKDALPGTTYNYGAGVYNPSADPPWFSWN